MYRWRVDNNCTYVQEVLWQWWFTNVFRRGGCWSQRGKTPPILPIPVQTHSQRRQASVSFGTERTGVVWFKLSSDFSLIKIFGEAVCPSWPLTNVTQHFHKYRPPPQVVKFDFHPGFEKPFQFLTVVLSFPGARHFSVAELVSAELFAAFLTKISQEISVWVQPFQCPVNHRRQHRAF